MNNKPYTIFLKERVIRVAHQDLFDSYWKRGQSSWERDMVSIARFAAHVAGLKRLCSKHNLRYGFVDFRFSEKNFGTVACALKLEYPPDQYYEKRLKEYPHPNVR